MATPMQLEIVGEPCMQRAKCPECRAEIGGMSHALATGNVHAPEMDGSRHAAWSEGANLANFDPL